MTTSMILYFALQFTPISSKECGPCWRGGS